MAFLDDNVHTQYAEMTETINSQTVNIPIFILNPISYLPNAAFLLYGITQAQTLITMNTAYRFSINQISMSVIEIKVTAQPGYAISWFSFVIVYGSPQYLITGQQSLTSLGPIQLFPYDTRIKRSFVSIISIECQANPRVQLVGPSFGLVTASTYSGTIVTYLTLSYIVYMPCPVYCTSCYAVPPNCDGCQTQTQRFGSTCTTCPSQMFAQFDQINCQQCKSYCNNCSGQSNNCTACKGSTGRSGAPNCTTCPLEMFLELFIDNCQPCKPYCNGCSGSTTNCIQCAQGTLRINAPDCLTCPAQYHVVSNTLICQPCLPYCNNCLAYISQCAACSSSSLRINPPDCLECPQFMYLTGNNCTQCNIMCDTCNSQGCLTCLSQATYINSLNECIACPSHCSSCDQYSCYSCLGNCVQCDLFGCLKCKDNNYYLQDTDCIECPGNCLSCNETTCFACVSPMILQDNTCRCQYPCLTCNSSECLTCISSDYKILQGNCYYCPDNCLTCDQSGNCLRGPTDCKRGILIGLQVMCTQCNSNYYLYNNICYQCSSACYECISQSSNCTVCRFPQVSQLECQLCESQFGYYSDYHSNTCNTICGDAIIAGTEQCDDGNSISKDGCTNCIVDEGYSCTSLLCSKIIYPNPILSQELKLDSPYNATKLLLLSYNVPIYSLILEIHLYFFPSIQFTYQICQIDTQHILIQVSLLEQSINSLIVLNFDNKQQILSSEGVQQQESTLFFQITDYLTMTSSEQIISDSTEQFINILIIVLIILICLAVLFGGLDIFWNLLDLLQTLSYLKYVNTIKPYYLSRFLNLFGFVQFQNLPFNESLNTQNYISSLLNHEDFNPPPLLISQDGFSSSTLINMIPILNVLLTSVFIYFGTQFIYHIIRNNSIANLVKCINKLSISSFIYDLVCYIRQSCDVIDKQWIWSGLIRIFISSANDVCFMTCLGLMGLQFSRSNYITQFNLNITILSLLAYLTICYIISNIAGFQSKTLLYKSNQLGSVFEGLRLRIWTRYYNIVLVIKKFLFMIFLVLLYNEPIFQICNIILLQIEQIIWLISSNPIKESNETQKQLICEILMLSAEVQLGILVIDDFLKLFEYNYRHIFGWIFIFLIVLIIVVQLSMDAYQQYKRYHKRYMLFRKFIDRICCTGQNSL